MVYIALKDKEVIAVKYVDCFLGEAQIAMGVFEGAFNLVTVFMELLHYKYLI